ncbi:MAG: four helix bundle protein [Gemmatimonadota bacterium]
MPAIKSHRELRVYQSAMAAALRAVELADRFPAEEKYGWRGQVHKCAPSVCANIGEAWRKRRYKRHFVSKLTDAEAEAAETQVWMEWGWKRGYITKEEFDDIFDQYEKVLAQLVLFEESGTKWGKAHVLVWALTLIGLIALIT